MFEESGITPSPAPAGALTREPTDGHKSGREDEHVRYVDNAPLTRLEEGNAAKN